MANEEDDLRRAEDGSPLAGAPVRGAPEEHDPVGWSMGSADTGADGIDFVIVRMHRNLSARAGFTRRRFDLHDSIMNFRDFHLK